MHITHGLHLTQRKSLAMTAELTRAIGMLKLSNADLAAELATLAAANAHLSVSPGEPEPGLALFQQRGAEAARRPNAPPPITSSGAGLAELTQAGPAPGLHDHLLRESRLLLRDPAEIVMAEALIQSVEPTGWLNQPLPDIAEAFGFPLPQVEAVLAKLQQIEPAGLFARSLSECLTLQAADRGVLTPAFAVVLDNLPLLAEGRLDDLTTRAGVTVDEVAGMLRLLRSFDPKPGTQFDAGAVVIAPPDLTLRRAGAGWQVELNRSTLPQLTVSDAEGGDAEDLRQARLLAQAVDRRNVTLLRVAQAVVQRQRDWLRRGDAGLVPLTLAGLAQELDLHETTIGRAVADRMMTTPRGTILLRQLFSTGIAMPGRAPVSATALRHRIAGLIAAEDPAAPLTDTAIAAHLRAEGLPLARRTVTKYREALGLAPAATRHTRPVGGPQDRLGPRRA